MNEALDFDFFLTDKVSFTNFEFKIQRILYKVKLNPLQKNCCKQNSLLIYTVDILPLYLPSEFSVSVLGYLEECLDANRFSGLNLWMSGYT